MPKNNEFSIKTTCPRDCYDSCGIVGIKDENGALLKLVGDPDHSMAKGKLCPKCSIAYNNSWIDDNQRLKTPLKRVGAKGDGKFVPISWDQALGDIAMRLQKILAFHPAHSIYHTHYTGTCAILGGMFPSRFFNRLGASEVDPDSVCNKAAHDALTYTFGDSCTGFDPETIKDCKTILVWGGNPSSAGPHVNDHWLAKTDAFVVAIDPIAHDTAKAADLHLQLRPGTDAALAFGLLHLARENGFVDQEFLEKNTQGWDDVIDDVRRATPDHTAGLTGLSVEDIKTAAQAYTSGPALIWLGQGLQRQKMGGNAYRSCALLCVATGNIAKPGAGILFLNGPNTRGADLDYVARGDLAQTDIRSSSQMDLAGDLNEADKVTSLFCWNNNIAASNPEQEKLCKGLEREDLFHVCVELFETDTTAYADYVLPAASFLEYDDLLFPYFHNTVSALAAVQDAPGEALPNSEIFRRLSAAMGFDESSLFESDRDVIDHVLQGSDAGINFDQLKAIGTKAVYSEPRVQFEDLQFATPSGKIEIASPTADAAGCWRSPRPHADERPKIGHIRILSPASKWTMNSSYANDTKIRRRLGAQSILLNPLDADALGVSNGDKVLLRNDTGQLEVVADLSPDTLPGVGIVWKGNWPKFEGQRGNINRLNPGDKTDMGESSCVHGIEAEIIRL